MKRNYQSGTAEDAVFFFGKEIEHTPAFGKNTLFVVGVQSPELIEQKLKSSTENIEHIFFGANHSFNPDSYEDWKSWEDMITFFLTKDYLCSLDIPLNSIEEFHDGGLCDFNNFIPQIRVPIPYIKLWNYNTMLKIDDKGFNQTNPGVWSHSLHDLLNRKNFTSWDQYKGDQIIS